MVVEPGVGPVEVAGPVVLDGGASLTVDPGVTLQVRDGVGFLVSGRHPDLPLEALPIPRLIELVEADPGYDGEGLRQRLAAEAPGAVGG